MALERVSLWLGRRYFDGSDSNFRFPHCLEQGMEVTMFGKEE